MPHGCEKTGQNGFWPCHPPARLIEETNSLGLTRYSDYDAVDNLISKIDRNGREIEFDYDNLDRLVNENWLNSSSAITNSFTFSYDAADQLLSASDNFSSYQYGYDLLGRMISVSNNGTVGVPTVGLTNVFDAVDNRQSVQATIDGVDDYFSDFNYDALDRMTSIRQTGTTVAEKSVEFNYDAADQYDNIRRFSDAMSSTLVMTSTFDFDNDSRLQSLTHADSTSGIFAQYSWDWDDADRITRYTSTADGTSDYTYDDRNQLTGADHDYQTDETYSYDENGNRTNAGYSTGANNYLTSDGTFNYTYDAEGNRTSKTNISTGELTEYVWDNRNRLTQVTEKSTGSIITNQVDFVYDVDNRRIGKTVDADGAGSGVATTERYVYDGDHISLVFDGSGTLQQRYLHGPKIDQILAEEDLSKAITDDARVLWQATDHLGTVREIVNNAGAVVDHVTYDSFGSITDRDDPTISLRFGYTGRELDSETDLYFYRARYYDASVGRFISEDPIGFEAHDANLNRYVGNSAITMRDPSGNSGQPTVPKDDVENFSPPVISKEMLTRLQAKLESELRQRQQDEEFKKAIGEILEKPFQTPEEIEGILDDIERRYLSKKIRIPFVGRFGATLDLDPRQIRPESILDDLTTKKITEDQALNKILSNAASSNLAPIVEFDDTIKRLKDNPFLAYPIGAAAAMSILSISPEQTATLDRLTVGLYSQGMNAALSHRVKLGNYGGFDAHVRTDFKNREAGFELSKNYALARGKGAVNPFFHGNVVLYGGVAKSNESWDFDGSTGRAEVNLFIGKKKGLKLSISGSYDSRKDGFGYGIWLELFKK